MAANVFEKPLNYGRARVSISANAYELAKCFLFNSRRNTQKAPNIYLI